jgi:hypothetical protein
VILPLTVLPAGISTVTGAPTDASLCRAIGVRSRATLGTARTKRISPHPSLRD